MTMVRMNPLRKTALSFLLAAIHVLASDSLSAESQRPDKVVILYSDSSAHTLRTISGLTWSLNDKAPTLEVREHFLLRTDVNQKDAIAALRPRLLITVGSTATAFADQHFPDISVVFAKVLNPLESGFIRSWDHPGGHITGASLDIPVKMQMEKFITVIPELKTIGVIYTASTRRLVEEARRAAGSLGLELVSYQLQSPRELPQALDSLCRLVDGIWTVADEELSTPQFVRFILLETLRRGIPIMGFNRSFVESGALFGLEADYKYIGRQAAEIALAILNGAPPSELKPTVPDVIYLYLNLKTGKHLNLSVPQDLVEIAKEIF